MVLDLNKAIVLVAGGEAMGGAERRFLRVFTAMVQKDPCIHLVINRELRQLAAKRNLLPNSVRNVHELVEWNILPLSKWKYLYWIIHSIQLLYFLLRYRLRLLHLVLTGVYIGFFAMHLPGVKSVATIVDSQMQVYSRLTKPIYRQALRRANLIDVLSPSIKSRLLTSEAFSHALKRKVRVSACSFTDYEHFRPAEEKADRIVYASRFEPVKSPLLMMDIARYVAAALPQAEIYVAGFGSLEEQVQERWARIPRDIRERIIVRRYADMAPVLASAKILLSLQRAENYPSQAILEAMACKCAIVATDVGDTRLLIDESVGLLVGFDAEEIAGCIVDLFRRPKHLQALGEAAYQRATQEFTVEKFIQYSYGLYDEILGSPDEFLL